MTLIDSHCHLDSEQFNDREAVIERALAAGVEHMVAIGSGDGPPDLEAGIRLADRYPFIYATIGVHPHDAAKATAETYRRLAALAGASESRRHRRDRPRLPLRPFAARCPAGRVRRADAHRPRRAQAHRDPYARSLGGYDRAAARALGPQRNLGGIIHCFSEGPREAEQALAIGFHISFAGIVTFPKATGVQEAARITPADRLLIETDAPYLAPVPNRGKRNEPAFVVETARKLAELRGVTPEEIARTTADNWRRLVLAGLCGLS